MANRRRVEQDLAERRERRERERAVAEKMESGLKRLEAASKSSKDKLIERKGELIKARDAVTIIYFPHNAKFEFCTVGMPLARIIHELGGDN